MRNYFLGATVIALALLSCRASQSSVSSSSHEPVGSSILPDTSKWYLAKIHQPQGITELTTRRAFIRFDESKGRAGGNGSCNTFGSSMTVKGDMISFSNIFSTKMYCDEVQSIENNFLGQLQKVTRYQIKEKSLLLYDGADLVLEFTRE